MVEVTRAHTNLGGRLGAGERDEQAVHEFAREGGEEEEAQVLGEVLHQGAEEHVDALRHALGLARVRDLCV